MLARLLAFLRPQPIGTQVDLAEALRRYELGDAAAVEQLCRLRLALLPRDPDTWALMALSRERLGEKDAARRAWGRVRKLDPTHPEALLALDGAARATGLAPASAEPASAFAVRETVARDMVSNWGQSDRLWRHGVWHDARLPQPCWDGAPAAGERVLVHTTGGFGDAIHFVRFAARLGLQGATVRYECEPPLQRLLLSCPGIAEVASVNDRGHAQDCTLQAPQISLLRRYFFPLDDAPAPYLSAPPDAVVKWKSRLAGLAGLKVGLCWAGKASNKNDVKRSLPLALLRPLLDVPGVVWLSLQKGPPAAQAGEFGGRLADFTAELDDFADTAALAASLDLVIAVNTSVAHLAGALGKPVWILYSHNEDRRWDVVGDAGKHYPRAKIFRQVHPGDWTHVVDSVVAALRDEVASRRGETPPAAAG